MKELRKKVAVNPVISIYIQEEPPQIKPLI